MWDNGDFLNIIKKCIGTCFSYLGRCQCFLNQRYHVSRMWSTQRYQNSVLWARAVAFQPRPMVVIVQKRKTFCDFFAFQAIVNTFYFWVKNLEKKYFKSQEDTPPPHNWKNILYLYFIFHAILSTFKFFSKNKYLIATNGPVIFRPARSDSYIEVPC